MYTYQTAEVVCVFIKEGLSDAIRDRTEQCKSIVGVFVCESEAGCDEFKKGRGKGSFIR